MITKYDRELDMLGGIGLFDQPLSREHPLPALGLAFVLHSIFVSQDPLFQVLF